MEKPIYAIGCEELRSETLPVESVELSHAILDDLSDSINRVAQEKEKTGFSSRPVGLSAPQIGILSRAFVARVHGEFEFFVNPVIVKRRHHQKCEEGCLSIPGVYGKTTHRSDIIDVEYFDVNLNRKKTRLRGFGAVIFQHEYDHLHGILFIDHLSKESQEQAREKIAALENGTYKSYYPMYFKS